MIFRPPSFPGNAHATHDRLQHSPSRISSDSRTHLHEFRGLLISLCSHYAERRFSQFNVPGLINPTRPTTCHLTLIRGYQHGTPMINSISILFSSPSNSPNLVGLLLSLATPVLVSCEQSQTERCDESPKTNAVKSFNRILLTSEVGPVFRPFK